MSKIVLITGASSGYGKATAKAFKDNGDTVIMTARNYEKLEQASKEIGGDMPFSMDVTKPEHWEKALNTIIEKYGRLMTDIKELEYSGNTEGETSLLISDSAMELDCYKLAATSAVSFKRDNNGFTAVVERDKENLNGIG